MNTGFRELTKKELTEVTGGDGLLGSIVDNTIETVNKTQDVLSGFSKNILAEVLNVSEDTIDKLI